MPIPSWFGHIKRLPRTKRDTELREVNSHRLEFVNLRLVAKLNGQNNDPDPATKERLREHPLEPDVPSTQPNRLSTVVPARVRKFGRRRWMRIGALALVVVIGAIAGVNRWNQTRAQLPRNRVRQRQNRSRRNRHRQPSTLATDIRLPRRADDCTQRPRLPVFSLSTSA
jgi:hypothetical protein